jgi:hypothetical protein
MNLGLSEIIYFSRLTRNLTWVEIINNLRSRFTKGEWKRIYYELINRKAIIPVRPGIKLIQLLFVLVVALPIELQPWVKVFSQGRNSVRSRGQDRWS